MDALMIWAFVLMSGGAIALLIWAGIRASAGLFSPMRRRLQELRTTSDVAVLEKPAPAGGWWQRLVSSLEPTDEEKRSEVQSRLVQAGLRSREALGLLFGIRLLLMVVLPVAILMAATSMDLRPSMAMQIGLVVFGIYLGWRLPGGFVNMRLESRQRTLMEGFPDALDLLVACTEAGLGFNAALERVVEQMPASHPDLAAELSLVNAEVRAGVDRTTALRNLADRTGLDEIRGLVSLITHSARLGTGIAGTLRIYAEEFRDRRMQRAEELAATVGTKLIFPLVVCLFPSFFVVAVGPAIIGVLRALSQTN